MRLIPLTLAGLGLTFVLTSAAVAASEKVTDSDFLKANRCRGLAAGIASDTSGYDAFIKSQDRGRDPAVDQMANQEQDRALRQARNPERASKVQAELADLCQTFKR